jgi:hypothetical protein
MPPKKKKYSELSATAKYYRNNPAARKKKAATDKKVNARPSQKKKRRECGRARTKAKSQGKNISNKDYDHATRSFVSPKTNRGRKGEGGRKKK